MKMKFFFVVAVLGFLTVTEARFPKFRLSNRRIEDPEEAAQINSKFEAAIDEKWRKHTKVEATNDTDVTLFEAEKLKSTIRGKLMTSLFNGRTIYAYQGFRFGRAERFKPPVDQGKYWDDDIFNATHIGLKCPQGAYVGDEPGGDEDCLFLNVYTPYKPTTTEAKDLAVMFFIYGGSFTSGDSSLYMPTKLLDHDVILVTTHYRLGAFGFYTRDIPDAPGNLAFYDMISALTWVQNYISDFGGDPTKVTIFGESAGSVSVNYMMLLTGGLDLFRGVIAESGSALDHWAFDEDSSYATNYYEHYVGCDIHETEDEILECMRNVPFQDLIHAGHAMVREDRRHGLIGFRGCSPTMQTFNDSGLDFKKILYQHPRDYFINRDFHDAAFMTGSNREEGSFVAGIMYSDYLQPNNLTDNATYLREEMFRDLLLSIGVVDEPMSIAKSMQESYCGDIDLADLNVAQYCLIDVCGIMFLKAGSWQVSNLHSYYSKFPTYYYTLEYEADDSMGDWVVADSSPFYTGITHADDLMYIFAMPAIMEQGPEKDVSQRMTLLWTNFARYLNPTPSENTTWQSLSIPEWTPYEFEKPHYMLFDAEFQVLEDFQDRWKTTNMRMGPPKAEECTGLCADYKDQKEAYMISMIVFVVAFVIACLVATYFFFKARR
ncbi:UNVERIFIED_CONTAM: hypothetical protein RMT77_004763 [Armadillidium vulgare]